MGESEINKTKIDGLQMVEDLYELFCMTTRELPRHINRDWHPEIKKIYAKMLAGEEDVGSYRMLDYYPEGREHYIYELSPIDDWTGYTRIYLEDIRSSNDHMSLLRNVFAALLKYTNWERDIREGPFIAMIPGTNGYACSYAVFLKQDNNGTTYAVLPQKLDRIQESFVNTIKY